MASHDITYVGIIQTARASGLDEFLVPYVLTNCHNSLCAVGGTINADDHAFGFSAAKRYGGIFVPAHQAVIHQYMREMMAGCGRMILGSDSHTRYGALGTLAVGEGGGELAKQLLGKTYDLPMPEVVGVYLDGTPQRGVGPQDIALAIIGAVFANGYVKNKIMEFVGPGIGNLSAEYRIGIDVMTTETSCLSSVWATDGRIEEYYAIHGRKEDYKELEPGKIAYYGGMVYVDMSKVKPMIAMPFHQSNVFSVDELNADLSDIIGDIEKKASVLLGEKAEFTLRDKIRDGGFYADQGVIAGCAGGTFDSICDAADILDRGSVGNGIFDLSVYPSSQPTFMALVENGVIARLMAAGAVVKTAICGPCFGAGDVPANRGFSLRHTTRNYPNREGSKPNEGQIASVALADARTVAATALNGGRLTPATDIDVNFTKPKYYFNKKVYENRVYDGFGKALPDEPLKLGPGIADWPEMPPMPEKLLLRVVSVINDPVTTTDEIIPSGETSSYRSNPLRLAEFTLSRKDPGYVGRAKEVRKAGQAVSLDGGTQEGTGTGSVVCAVKPGDGSAREQAASCQKVLGGWANIAREYATKRYRSNLINWGIIPFVFGGDFEFKVDDAIIIEGIRKSLEGGEKKIKAILRSDGADSEITLSLPDLTTDEAEILLAGCLINHYKKQI